jgi:hypothetical protein
MAEKPGDVSFAELHEAKDKRQADLHRIQAFLERPADHVFRFPTQIDGKWLEFRRWTHDQANLLLGLPFYHKLVDEEGIKNLSPEDRTKLLALEVEMVRASLVEPKRWTEWLNDASQVDKVWWYISAMSGPSIAKLREFFESDWGQAYGAFYILRMGKFPSEIGLRPDSDIKAINVFLSVWSERQSK